MSSEASSSELFILLLFFQRSQNPFFQKSHFFKKSAPFSPLFSTILSTTRFCFAPFHASFALKNLSNSLYFSHQILHSFTQFIETWFLAFLEARFWPSAPSQIPVNSYTNYLSTFAQNHSQKNAWIRSIMSKTDFISTINRTKSSSLYLYNHYTFNHFAYEIGDTLYRRFSTKTCTKIYKLQETTYKH